MSDTKKLLSTLGLCRKAGKAVLGTNLICDAFLHTPNLTVFMACDASENTRKRLAGKCEYYGARLFEINADAASLGAALGKTGALAAVAVTDKNLSRSAEKHL